MTGSLRETFSNPADILPVRLVLSTSAFSINRLMYSRHGTGARNRNVSCSSRVRLEMLGTEPRSSSPVGLVSLRACSNIEKSFTMCAKPPRTVLGQGFFYSPQTSPALRIFGLSVVAREEPQIKDVPS